MNHTFINCTHNEKFAIADKDVKPILGLNKENNVIRMTLLTKEHFFIEINQDIVSGVVKCDI